MTDKQIESVEDYYDDYMRYSKECFGISYTNANPCNICDDKKECSEKYFQIHPKANMISPSICENEEPKTLFNLMKEETIVNLMNYGGVNKHKAKAGETWHYHFDKNCTVLLVFEDDQ